MEKIIMTFRGYSEIDKNDLKITDLNLNKIDVSEMSVNDILEMYKKGECYVTFDDSYKATLDGEITIELDKEELW